jgi:Kef-type K+ transport system membrane component KefB
MDPLLQFLLVLAIIIAVAKTSGYASTRLGQPAVLGELLAGLLLGPTMLDMMHWPVFDDPHLAETLSHLSHLGVLLLMFVAGLEVDLEAMSRSGRAAGLAGVFGVVAPIALGIGVALPFGFDLERSFYIGLVLAATSVSISAQTLMEIKMLRTRVGLALLGAAIVDDVLVILMLSAFIALEGGGAGALAILWVLVKMVVYLGAGVGLGLRWIPRASRLVEGLPVSEGVLSLALVVTLLYAWAAEALGGMAAITGAFLAGLFFARTAAKPALEQKMHTLTYSWLVPIFFVSIGLEANARVLGRDDIPFTLLITAVALVSKVVGSGAGAWLGGFSRQDALRLGVGMASRGEVGLIVASVGIGMGLIGEVIFASVVIMVLVTTLLTPILLRMLYPKPAQVRETFTARS